MAYIKDYELRKIFLEKTNLATAEMEVPISPEKISPKIKGKPKSSDYKYCEVYDAIKRFRPTNSEK